MDKCPQCGHALKINTSGDWCARCHWPANKWHDELDEVAFLRARVAELEAERDSLAAVVAEVGAAWAVLAPLVRGGVYRPYAEASDTIDRAIVTERGTP